jgi:pimeloyl-ACP methyl ester carboxylesterase
MKLNIFIFLLVVNFAFGQKGNVINKESTSFQIKDKNENIDFIIFDTKLDSKKPVFLWCQGSLPYPLYVDSKEGIWLIGGGIRNFDVEEITKYYHLVIISMPKTPLIAKENQINNAYWYFGNSQDKNTPTEEFQKADFLENYTNRAIKVLKFLGKQKWVDDSKLIVAGHSQGSKVATKIAKNYNKVSKLGLFGANPFGRIDQNIRDSRKEAENKRISWEKADKEIEEQYDIYRNANNPEKLKSNINLITWKSFSEPLLEDWLKITKPIYLAYGTNDIASDLCDIVPLFFIRNHKSNLTYKRYLNLEHNFFEVDEDGSANHEKPHWKEVMSSFVKWSLK